MKRITGALCAITLLVLGSCSSKVTSTQINGWQTANTTVVSYNKMTMDLDSEPITYAIDITTEQGRAKLNNLTLQEARDLVLVEAIMAAKCATIFQPQYTHVVEKGKVLGIKVYGFPARYKKE